MSFAYIKLAVEAAGLGAFVSRDNTLRDAAMHRPTETREFVRWYNDLARARAVILTTVRPTTLRAMETHPAVLDELAGPYELMEAAVACESELELSGQTSGLYTFESAQDASPNNEAQETIVEQSNLTLSPTPSHAAGPSDPPETNPQNLGMHAPTPSPQTAAGTSLSQAMSQLALQSSHSSPLGVSDWSVLNSPTGHGSLPLSPVLPKLNVSHPAGDEAVLGPVPSATLTPPLAPPADTIAYVRERK